MTQRLDQTDATILELAEAAADASTFPLDRETLAAISEGLAQAGRGKFVDDRIVAEADQRHGI